MAKRSKLTEKGTRMPEVREGEWEKAFSAYLREMETLASEPARSQRFAMLLQELLGLQPRFVEDYCAGVEKYLKVRQKDHILRGKADNLFGNVVIEFERDISKNRSEAEEQLRRYVAILWGEEPPDARTPYLCLATDGVRFITYSPVLEDPGTEQPAPGQVRLHVLEEADWTTLQPREAYLWLDRYFLRKEILPPTTEAIVADFGVRSHALQTTTHALGSLWGRLRTEGPFQVVYDSWEKYLRIVYGSEVASEALFLRHTYLATLAKVMAWMRLTDERSLPDEAQIVRMLEGGLFKQFGIENFIEEDFFSWLVRGDARKAAAEVVRWLFSLLQNYNLRELSEDVLKSLYQELVDPETRHDLGEFYTPDWLAHRMVRKALEDDPRAAVLDPACGSGTFLYLTIREKRERLGDSLDTLRHILESVCGADIHPLAVIVAKTNYILALGDLLQKRRGRVSIPVYLADTLRLPEFRRQARMTEGDQLLALPPGYEVDLDGHTILLPEALLGSLTLHDQAIELAREFALEHQGREMDERAFQAFLRSREFPKADDPALVHALFAIAAALKGLAEAGRDSIWAFVLKNVYKPLFLRDRFHLVLGNPPWIAFRYMEPGYQRFVKQQITKEYALLTGRGELITHMEVATLFLVRAADLYLRPGGQVGFVLPRSLFTADQHDGLRRRQFKFPASPAHTLAWREAWDCEEVSPLFNVPACVLWAEKVEAHPAPKEAPFPGQVLRGTLRRKNASLAEAEDALTVEETTFALHQRGKRSYWGVGEATSIQVVSPYRDRFLNGATIYPRPFWFVQVRPSPLGFDPAFPPLETDERARKQAKAPYRDLVLRGNVEAQFLYATLLSTDLLPFGHLGYRLVVLPIEPEGDHYRLVDAAEARRRGLFGLAAWLETVEREWAARRGAKAERMTALERLDYQGNLTKQNPQARYRVLYNSSGTNLVSCVVEGNTATFRVLDQSIVVLGTPIDHTLFIYETSSREDAFYLSALLNAPQVDRRIKPMQARGLWGERHIHKKVLELPIPQFDPADPVHARLAALGEACHEKVAAWLAAGGPGKVRSIGRLRGLVREMLQEELAEIDALVGEVLGG
ncbi:MAG: SAM-dependent DNA methyltransferase [Anaerolineae bacterium]|nr:SAM-dependent DNA methyltransferase [Anaerolineae bacterium]